MRSLRFGFGSMVVAAAATVVVWSLAFAAFRAAEITAELRLLREAMAGLQERLDTRVAASSAVPSPPAIPVVTLENANGASVGRKDAPVTIVEFTDLECPFCSKFTSTTFPELKRRFVDAGLVRFITKDFPLPSHPNAREAAIASRCAGEQGKFWEFRHELSKHAQNLSRRTIDETGRSLKLDLGKFSSCMGNPLHGINVDRDYAEGARAGVGGTPTFIIGKAAGAGLVGQSVVGAQELQTFETQIRALLPQ